jgi:hypothetical protein
MCLHGGYTLDFLKVIGGLIMASLGFVGMTIAIMRYFIGQIQDILYIPLDLSINSLIVLGIISLLVFIGGVYLILRYGGH